MKLVNYIVLIFTLSQKLLLGDTIADPTFDPTFKQLFGSNGKVLYDSNQEIIDTPQQRLCSFLNSILNPILGIQVQSLKYKPLEATGGNLNSKTTIFDILTQCKCIYEEKSDSPFYVDIEMQKKGSSEYIQRTIFYGSHMIAQYSKKANYENQPKSIIISIIDSKLSDFPQDTIFYIGPCFKKVHSMAGSTSQDGKLIQAFPVQIFIQLPLLCKEFQKKTNFANAIKNPKSKLKNQENPNDFSTNEWLLLLGSRRLCCKNLQALIQKGRYDVNSKFFSNKEVRNSIQILKQIDSPEYQLAIENMKRKLDDTKIEKRAREAAEKELQAISKKIKTIKQEIATKNQKLEAKDQEIATKDQELEKNKKEIEKLLQQIRQLQEKK